MIVQEYKKIYPRSCAGKSDLCLKAALGDVCEALESEVSF